MGIREKMNEHKGLAVGAAVLIIVAAVAASIWQVSAGGPPDDAFGGKSFFTVDDGATLFTDRSDHFPPFEHEGKPAYRAAVFTCDGGKTRWVAYLERYTPEGKKMAAELLKKLRESKGPPSFAAELLPNIEVKRPGDKEWIKQSDIARVAPIMAATCPHNGSHETEPVLP